MYALWIGRGYRRAALMVWVAAIAACAACARQFPGVPRATTDGVVEEARAFMRDYARDLLAGDREAIAARYDRGGAYLVGNGRKEFAPYDSIVALYRGADWSPPASFEWLDLSFEPAGAHAVVVAGRLLWGARAGATPIALSYTALLRRQGGVLRIRLENESSDPQPPPPPAREPAG